MRLGFRVEVLPREPEVHGDGALALEDTRRPEGFGCSLPACCSVFGCRQLRRAQVIRVQIVDAGATVREAAIADVRLPDRIGAP